MIGDGTGLRITHTCSTTLNTTSNSFHLQNILCVPQIRKNLISIYQLCVSNNISIEFLPLCFLVKDLLTRVIRAKGETNGGIYEWSGLSPKLSSPVAFSSFRISPINWHSRLGHPSYPTLQFILSKNKLDSTSMTKHSSCNACCCKKSHKLCFSVSSLQSCRPLDIIFSDVWTAPLHSIDDFKYNVVFIDHYI